MLSLAVYHSPSMHLSHGMPLDYKKNDLCIYISIMQVVTRYVCHRLLLYYVDITGVGRKRRLTRQWHNRWRQCIVRAQAGAPPPRIGLTNIWSTAVQDSPIQRLLPIESRIAKPHAAHHTNSCGH